MLLIRIVSGGQAGADRAALDAAIAKGIDHGGWAPRGRRAEDGAVPQRYEMLETPSVEPRQRTEWNVRDSDATLIIASPPLRGGTKLTQELAADYARPCLLVNPTSGSIETIVDEIVAWLSATGANGATLNVAGPRATEDPGIYEKTYDIVTALIDKAGKADLSPALD